MKIFGLTAAAVMHLTLNSKPRMLESSIERSGFSELLQYAMLLE